MFPVYLTSNTLINQAKKCFSWYNVQRINARFYWKVAVDTQSAFVVFKMPITILTFGFCVCIVFPFLNVESYR